MSVASHLHIRLDEYDARIRTFIPGYEQMLDAGARALRALDRPSPVIVDLGTGTGAFAARCISVRSDAHVIAIDEDAAILDLARKRLARESSLASFVQSSFLDAAALERAVPRCDAIVASLALHHIRTIERKRQFYGDCHRSLMDDGLLVSVDCFVSADARLAELEREVWRAHLRQSYSESETDRYFAAWATEDVYLPLMQELALMRDAGFSPDVIWRVAPFAAIVSRKAPPSAVQAR